MKEFKLWERVTYIKLTGEVQLGVVIEDAISNKVVIVAFQGGSIREFTRTGRRGKKSIVPRTLSHGHNVSIEFVIKGEE